MCSPTYDPPDKTQTLSYPVYPDYNPPVTVKKSKPHIVYDAITNKNYGPFPSEEAATFAAAMLTMKESLKENVLSDLPVGMKEAFMAKDYAELASWGDFVVVELFPVDVEAVEREVNEESARYTSIQSEVEAKSDEELELLWGVIEETLNKRRRK